MSSLKQPATTPLIHIIRHGQALHNIERGYPYRDPPLTPAGFEGTKKIELPSTPDLILISPMTRTIQTALNAFPSLLLLASSSVPSKPDVQIWPDLREAHDAECNKGVSRADMVRKFPQFSFEECEEEWVYPPFCTEDATKRAEGVRRRLKGLEGRYANVVIVTHRRFIAFLVKGGKFDVCERRSYRFRTEKEAGMEGLRMGVNADTNEVQDFGPTVLVPYDEPGVGKVATADVEQDSQG
ncbi:histidine phosphatase superfamily [Usnea florida]